MIRTLQRLSEHSRSCYQTLLGRPLRFSLTLPFAKRSFRVKVPAPSGRKDKVIRVLVLAFSAALAVATLMVALPYVVRLSFSSLPVWAAVISLHLINLHFLRFRRERELRSPRTLARLTKVDLEGGRVRWELSEEAVSKFKDLDILAIPGLLAALLVGAATLAFLRDQHAFAAVALGFWKFRAPVPEPVNVSIAAIATAGWVFAAHRRFQLHDPLQAAVERVARTTVENINTCLGTTVAQLESEVSQIKELASRLSISSPLNYLNEIRLLLDTHKADIVAHNEVLIPHVAEVLDRARLDRAAMEKAENIQTAAAQLFTETCHEVNKTGLMPLIRDLDQMYQRLQAPQIRALLERRDWEGYQNAVTAVVDDMKRLRELSERADPDEPTAVRSETEIDRAFRILRLPDSADAEDLRKAYRWLITVWHPDRGIVKNDEEIKQINWAYGFLKRHRFRT